MSRPVLYFAITSHGFGHAARSAALAGAIQQLYPEILLILVTTIPRWLLESYIPGDFIQRPRSFDVGVIQSDSLTMDKEATLEKLRQIRSQQRSMIASEVNFLKTNRVGLVLADIPPLAVSIAHTAGIPCWMVSNFGWNFIYRDWGGEFAEIAKEISEQYSKCDRLFRLPLHEPMSAFPHITDVGLVGGFPRYSESEIRQTFSITHPKEKTVLLTFGGLGLQGISYSTLSHFSDWQFITFDKLAPDLPNLLKIQNVHYRPVDFMPLCGRVVCKPGYSTFAEALITGVPIVSLTRENFAEAEVLLSGIQEAAYHQIITPAEFAESNWEFLHSPLLPPRNPDTLDRNGTNAIATEIFKYF